MLLYCQPLGLMKGEAVRPTGRRRKLSGVIDTAAHLRQWRAEPDREYGELCRIMAT
jgi:hypothetical protein